MRPNRGLDPTALTIQVQRRGSARERCAREERTDVNRWNGIVILILTLSAWSLGTEAGQIDYTVFVLGGQSNMEGQAETAQVDKSLRRDYPNTDLYLFGKRVGLFDQPKCGPEISFADSISEALHDSRIILVKYAVGGTSLLAWAPDWDETRAKIAGNESAGPLYRNLLGQIATATEGKRVHFGAVLWMQGERDAKFVPAAEQYEAHFLGLIERVRADLRTPDLLFLYGQVNPPRSTYPGLEQVRQAQLRVQNRIANVRMVDTDDLSKLADQLHYDAKGQITLGRRFAQAYLSMRK